MYKPYNYKFYFPTYERKDNFSHWIGENWPFNAELAVSKYNTFFNTYAFSPTDTGYVEDNARQINYNVTNKRPKSNYYYYVNLDAIRLAQLDFFASAYKDKDNYMKFKLPIAVRRDLDAGICKIVFDNSLEGFQDKAFLWEIFYEKTGLDPLQCVFITGDYSLDTSKSIPTVYRNSWEKYISLELHKTQMNTQQLDHAPCAIHFDESVRSITTRTERPFYALALNRLMRVHRIALVKTIDDMGLADKINYSFGMVTHHDSSSKRNLKKKLYEEKMWHTAKIFNMDDKELHKWAKGHGEKNIAEEPKLNLHINQANNYNDVIFSAYRRSYFSLVSETNCTEPTLFQSEKAFKPILNLQPFVFLGERGSIQAMRDLGYNVFDDYINHSYDAVEDPADRLQVLMEEVKRLCNISKTDWNDMLLAMLPKLITNYSHLQTAFYRHNELHTPLYKGVNLQFPHQH